MLSFLLYLLTICIFLGKMVTHVLYPFLNWVIFFSIELSSLLIFKINSLSDVWFINIFFHSVGFLLLLLIVSFADRLMQSYLSIFAHVDCVLGVITPKKHCPGQCQRIFPMFSFYNFEASGVTFKSLTNFYFWMWYEIRIHFHPSAWGYPASLFEEMSFPHCVFSTPLSNINWS